MQPKLYPRLMLAVLTGLNILNYVDRNILFAVQSDIQKEFGVSKTEIGVLTSAFFFTYMFAAPLVAGWATVFHERTSWSSASSYGADSHCSRGSRTTIGSCSSGMPLSASAKPATRPLLLL